MHKSWIVAALLLASLSLHAEEQCDLSTQPAATLLLPYFEVDFNAPQTTARTTLFSVINTSPRPQIARVTLWTDWSYPVLSFNVFLTGYDVQSVNLYDILGPRGTIVLQERTTGSASLPNDANPHFLPSASAACANLPGTIPAPLLQDVRTALTTGTSSSCGTVRVGGVHANAIGYATVDVVATCGTKLPNDFAYYNELLYDNVLAGDWQILNPNPLTGNYAGGDPLVHIRAFPEGGPAGVLTPTELPFTFYNRFLPHQARDVARMDRRQPLPSSFAIRYIQGGTGAFNTNFQIWREGVTGSTANCRDYGANNGSAMTVSDLVRFDEHENPTTNAGGIIICTFPSTIVTLPSASSTPSSAGIFPPLSGAAGDVGGWMFLNLTNRGSANYSVYAPRACVARPSQNWVVTSMTAEGRYQVAYDGTPLGNACNAAPAVTNATNPIKPLREETGSCDIATLPAATLLLPYFEVDLNAPAAVAKTTIFTVTNTTRLPQIAHATIWTDWGFPVLDFNIFLTGYDVQSINLYDILGPQGVIGSRNGTTNEIEPGARSLDNDGNPKFNPRSAFTCSILPGFIPANILADIRTGLTTGAYSTCGKTRIGGTHANATGYVTVDVVSDCTVTLPPDPKYFRDEVLFDNVLTGDYAWINPSPATGNYAGGNPLVHIRAVSEPQAKSFYERFTTLDRRQPLPSQFAARYIEGGTNAFNTDFAIWRETSAGSLAACRDFAQNAALPLGGVVRFDEHENPTLLASDCPPLFCTPTGSALPLTSRTSSASPVFPPLNATSGDVGGWMYLDLGPRQNWVTVSMSADGRFSTAFDAVTLANGCSTK
jgi:hypothetical protein